MLKYDAFEHLGQSIFAKPRDLFLMLTAYFDERNTSEARKVAIVAGWLAPTRRWGRFSNRWTKLLHDYRIKPEDFHRTDIQHRRGKFSHWNEPYRDDFLRNAHRIIRNNKGFPIGHAVITDEYKAAFPNQQKGRMGGVYGWCAFCCLQSVKLWCNEHGHKQPIRFVFECGAKGSGQIMKMLNEIYKDEELRRDYRLGGFSFEGKAVKPLHAADMISFDLGRFTEDVVAKQFRQGVAAYLIDLLGKEKPDVRHLKFWTKENLRGFVDDWRALS